MANYGEVVPKVGRRLRSPQHPFYLEHMPFQIQPFLLAPVIPGETMKNAMLQSRVVTDPIANKLIGWWIEYYFFYVKHRDLAGRDDFAEMMLSLDKDMSVYQSAVNVAYNHYSGSINWAEQCLQRVVETYFRNEGEAWNAFTINSMPAAAANMQSWVDSAALNDQYVVEDPVVVSETAGTLDDTSVTASEIDEKLRMWQFQRANNITEMTYEDWLRSFGISVAQPELHVPELLRYIREWQYPSNTIDPADGSAASAVSWAIRDRLDKDRFFREPGFILGVTVARPKVYAKNITGSVADSMTSAFSWLPALMRDDPWTSMMHFADGSGPFDTTVVTDNDGYWLDVKDLLLYGSDFVNVARSGTGLNMISVPSADLSNKWYPSDSDVDGLFVGTADTARQVRQDGIVSLSILGAQVDTTPTISQGR